VLLVLLSELLLVFLDGFFYSSLELPVLELCYAHHYKTDGTKCRHYDEHDFTVLDGSSDKIVGVRINDLTFVHEVLLYFSL